MATEISQAGKAMSSTVCYSDWAAGMKYYRLDA